MTDRYAVRLFEQIYIPKPWAIDLAVRQPTTDPRHGILRGSMLLDLSRIRTPHERYEKAYPADAFPADDSFRVVAPVALAFDIRKDKQHFQLTGGVQTALELPCSRCLEPFVRAGGCGVRPAVCAARS